MDKDTADLLDQIVMFNTVVAEVQQRVDGAVHSVQRIVDSVHQIARYQAVLARAVEQRVVQNELDAILAITAAQEGEPLR